MANDWIKIRGALSTHPRVARIASILEESRAVGAALTTGFNGPLSDLVKRDVTRDITLASLMRVWCAANEHTDDGVWVGITPEEFDHIAGVPGFGAAMEAVGWAVYDEESNSTTLPNFLEHNVPAKRGRSDGAERQRRYRERMKAGSDAKRDASRDVTSDVTRYDREEKRRDITPIVPAERFEEFWKTYPGPRKVGKAKCLAIWRTHGFDLVADQILLHIAAMVGTPQWREAGGKFIPAPQTYLNQRRFEDGFPEEPRVRLAI